MLTVLLELFALENGVFVNYCSSVKLSVSSRINVLVRICLTEL